MDSDAAEPEPRTARTGTHLQSTEVTGGMVRAQESLPAAEPAPVTDDECELHFGCSMLRRTRLYLKGRDRPAMRCALGYSVRTEEDKRRCLAVEDPSECWHLAAAKRATTQTS